MGLRGRVEHPQMNESATYQSRQNWKVIFLDRCSAASDSAGEAAML